MRTVKNMKTKYWTNDDSALQKIVIEEVGHLEIDFDKNEYILTIVDDAN